mmetsp:Transcript_27853/g.64516  ORF Transcript_27853/g.64516 Transcript_27853/m.64516 type:complete len:127 (-) Transcript_27853:1208-1588(-)
MRRLFIFVVLQVSVLGFTSLVVTPQRTRTNVKLKALPSSQTSIGDDGGDGFSRKRRKLLTRVLNSCMAGMVSASAIQTANAVQPMYPEPSKLSPKKKKFGGLTAKIRAISGVMVSLPLMFSHTPRQ